MALCVILPHNAARPLHKELVFTRNFIFGTNFSVLLKGQKQG